MLPFGVKGAYGDQKPFRPWRADGEAQEKNRFFFGDIDPGHKLDFENSFHSSNTWNIIFMAGPNNKSNCVPVGNAAVTRADHVLTIKFNHNRKQTERLAAEEPNKATRMTKLAPMIQDLAEVKTLAEDIQLVNTYVLVFQKIQNLDFGPKARLYKIE